jgi:chromosome segregation ATPase
MTTSLRSILATAAAGIIVVLTATFSLGAAPQANRTVDPLSALLAEVRALRIAMEQNATIAPRVQLALARLNIEEQRIAQLAGQLDRARQEVSAGSLQLRKMSDELEDVERQIQTTTDDKVRRALALGGVPDLKMRIKAQTAAEQAARERENDVLQALSTEQGRWLELNSRLDELERLLAPIPR